MVYKERAFTLVSLQSTNNCRVCPCGRYFSQTETVYISVPNLNSNRSSKEFVHPKKIQPTFLEFLTKNFYKDITQWSSQCFQGRERKS